jgi:hypothetical protein
MIGTNLMKNVERLALGKILKDPVRELLPAKDPHIGF